MNNVHDLIIIGTGPAGYTAATYAARAQLSPVVFAGNQIGGQLMWTTEVENFPGFAEGIQGPQLMANMQQQAERFGAQIVYSTVDRVDFSSVDHKSVFVQAKDGEQEYRARAVIISTGASSIMLGIAGEERLIGRGVSTCAVCDAAFFKEKDTVVVGGGDSAMEDALALTKFAKSVTIVHRRDSFRASKIMQERVLNHPKVKVLWNATVEEIIGEQKVEQLKVQVNGERQDITADGIFLAIGHRPATSLFAGTLTLDPHGYIVTGQSGSALGVQMATSALADDVVQFPTMTSVAGVFAAGDVVDVRFKQAITAAGQGCAAALDAERWLERVE